MSADLEEREQYCPYFLPMIKWAHRLCILRWLAVVVLTVGGLAVFIVSNWGSSLTDWVKGAGTSLGAGMGALLLPNVLSAIGCSRIEETIKQDHSLCKNCGQSQGHGASFAAKVTSRTEHWSKLLERESILFMKLFRQK